MRRPFLLLLATLAVAPAVARAQATGGDTFLDHLGLDRFQLQALGVSAGRIDPAQVEPTRVYGLSADYGEIAPRWRLGFTVTYWESRMSDDAVRIFLDTLRGSIIDPTGDDTLVTSRISLYDLAIGLGLNWSPIITKQIRPHLGVGMAANVINAEGKLIESTFVERALDNIAAGFFGSAGIELRPSSRFALDFEARADLVSGFRSVQVRGGAVYHLGPARRTPQ